MSHSNLWKLSVKQLGTNLAEAVELAQLLREAVPSIRIEHYDHGIKRTPSSSGSTPKHWSTKERLQKATTCSIDQGQIDWNDLRFVVSTENLRAQESPFSDAQLVEVNTGGRVYFCIFKPSNSSPLKQPTYRRTSDDADAPGRAGSTAMDTLSNPKANGPHSSSNGTSTQPISTATDSSFAAASSHDNSSGINTSTAGRKISISASQALERYLESADAGYSDDPGSGSPGSIAQQRPTLPALVHSVASYPSTPLAKDLTSAQPSGELGEQQPEGPTGRQPERVVVLKVASSRLLAQAEQFANELTRYLDVCAPDCRIVRQVGSTAEEWRQLVDAAGQLGDDGEELLAELAHVPCALLMEYVPGEPLAQASSAFQEPHRQQTCHDLGGMFLLDMLLGNADRLPCTDLSWRGNPGNVLFGTGQGKYGGRLVAIDSAVQRRPPALRSSADDERTERLAQLLLHSKSTASEVLRQILSQHASAGEVSKDLRCLSSFQEGLKTCLSRVLQIQGLLEMVQQVQHDLMATFLEDIAACSPDTKAASPDRLPSPSAAAIAAAAAAAATVSGGSTPSPSSGSCAGSPDGKAGARPDEHTSPKRPLAPLRTVTPRTAEMLRTMTLAIREISVGARHDEALGDRVQHWKRVFKDRGEDLKAAMGAWQARHRLERVLTTGFLDGSHPIVDGYELKVRLEHMLRRLKALQGAAVSRVPSLIEHGLYLGDAVCADAHHVLRHLGVTHLVNATQDLLLPSPEAGFISLRVPLRDVDDEDIGSQLGVVQAQLAAAKAGGGALLVHCHEGVSRSATLVLAYLMQARGMTLKQALEHVRSVRPQAHPNAGFMKVLAGLDALLHGAPSLQVAPSSRPQAHCCPECSVAVGISKLSLLHHLRSKHPGSSSLAAAEAEQQ